MTQSNIVVKKNPVGWMVILCLGFAGLAIAIHSPGHLSYDSTVQLYEASIRVVVGTHPPMMSMILRLLGGGETATSIFVFICSFLTYGSFALVIASVTGMGIRPYYERYALYRLGIIFLLIANPIVFLYVGIIWKDVLFASLLAIGVAAGIASGVNNGFYKFLLAFGSAISLFIAMFVRQQGFLLVPLLLVIPFMGWSKLLGKPSKIKLLSSVLLILATGFVIAFYVISRSDGITARSFSEGFRTLMVFDIAGTFAHTGIKKDDFSSMESAKDLESMATSYDSARVDTLFTDPVANRLFDNKSNLDLRTLWLQVISVDPKGYILHRLHAYATLMGLRDIQNTLPIHVGLEGDKIYLDALNLVPGQDERDIFLYSIASFFLETPIFRHFFWFLLYILGVVILFSVKMPEYISYAAGILSFSILLFYLSFIPTMIASDFRYLYPAIPLVTLLWLLILIGGERKNGSMDSIRAN